MSTLVPLTPGGAGTQQVMLAYALSQTATATENETTAAAGEPEEAVDHRDARLHPGAMIAFGTASPIHALRSARLLARS